MNCNEVRPLIESYSDGEVDAARAQDIEGHMEICALCAEALKNQQSLHRVLTRADLYSHADHKLARDVRSALKRCAAKESRPIGGLWPWLAFGSIAASIAMLAFIVTSDFTARDKTLVAEITSAHIRSLLADHLTDVASEDRHTVKPWFTGKLDFAPPVKDLSDAGFVLVGGRVDYVNHHSVAALVFKHQQHVVNVFVVPRTSNSGTTKSSVQDGFNVVHWTGVQMDFWAVSDLNRLDLEKLQHLLTE